jgi:hypothetical protein
LPPRLSSLNGSQIRPERSRVSADQGDVLRRDLGLVQAELSGRDKGEVGGDDLVEDFAVRVESADGFEGLDGGVRVRWPVAIEIRLGTYSPE